MPLCSIQASGLRNADLKVNAGAKRYDQMSNFKIQALSSHPPSGLFNLYIKLIGFKQLRLVECHCDLVSLED